MGVYNFAYFNGKLGASHEPVAIRFLAPAFTFDVDAESAVAFPV